MRTLLTIGAMLIACSGLRTNSALGQNHAAQNDQEPSAYQAERLRIPHTVVYDQNGSQLDFYDDLIKGKTVAINFFYSTSTTTGPPMMATFRRVQQILTERKAQRIQLISISVDPATDTPERLLAYAEKFKSDPGWSFISAEPRDLAVLLKALGAWVEQKENVTPMILIGNDAAREWTRTYGLAPPGRIVDQILAAASRKAPVKSTRTKLRRKQ